MLIVNPVSGRGRVKGELLNIISGLDILRHGIPVFVTEKRGDAAFFAMTYGKDFDRVVCTGGDGTLCEVITGLIHLDPKERPVLGYIPLGTGNYMAENLGIPTTPEKAVSLIHSASPRPLDIGALGGKYFTYIAAFGAFTEISYETPQNLKNNLGFLAYLLLAINSMPRITSFHAVVEYDSGTFDGDFIFGAISNSTTVANVIRLNSDDVTLDDGLFEVLLVRTPKNTTDLSTTIGCILAKNYNNENLCLFHSSRVKFTFNSAVPWTVDGESGGVYWAVEAVNHRHAVKMLF